ncbi:MAG: threonine--tRNA ligase [Myxococcota bacterium]|nr:threonine--tRNA ligase [Myxococcota bacterium]
MTEAPLELELPDGTRLAVPFGATPLDVASEIGPGLARAALAGAVAGRLVDLREPLSQSGAFRVITARDPEAGEVIRHSAEHVMADAVKRLWPETQIDVGRSDHGEKFQYDLDVPVRLTPEHFETIEAEMRRIVEAKQPFEREVVEREEAKRLFASQGQELKVSRIDDIEAGAELTLFRNGDFVDLCRGPHVQQTGQIGAFKLTEVGGSYWRGDESNPMLQRIYGVAFSTEKELSLHLERLEEARRRDHRRIGADLDLFWFHAWAPGAPFYLPKGLVLFNTLVGYMRELNLKYGFEEVTAPLLFDVEIFKRSGHYEMFPDMFKIGASGEDAEVGVKPMNCPGHCLIFGSRKRSYRELPLRLAEFSRLHRNERSGTLLGMTRVRAMSQDDAHIYCQPDQVEAEMDRVLQMTAEVYRGLGLSGLEVRVATRPEQYIGEIGDWERAEALLGEATERAGFSFEWAPGEGAFYGPKIEFHFRDVLGRQWQLGTLQIDMAMPERFDLSYVGADGQEHVPAMMHKAILGTLERFIGIYLEHTGGDLPLWLAPVQAQVLPIADRHEEYARKVCEVLGGSGLRVEVDARSETLGYRIRSAETSKIPYILVTGDREAADGTVTVRRRHQKAQTRVGVDELCSKLEEEVKTRGIS